LPKVRGRGTRAERLDASDNVRPRDNLGNQTLDLTLGPEARPGEKLAVIVGREIRREEQQAREMDRSLGQHLEEHGKFPSDARRLGPPLRLVLGKAKLVNAVRVERRAGALTINAAHVDLGEVSEEVCGEGVVPPSERLHLGVKPVVRDVIETEALDASRTRHGTLDRRSQCE
jgi:hypothetical protein